MKRFLSFLIFSALSLAAETNLTEVMAPEGKLDSWRFQTGGSVMGTVDGNKLISGSGIFVNVAKRAEDNSPLFIGVETGLIESNDLASGASYDLFPFTPAADLSVESLVSVPILPSLVVRDEEGGTLHWYAGVSAGPVIDTVTVRYSPTGERKTKTEVSFMAIFRGGADIDIGDTVALNAELLRFGLFQNSFAYLPVLSLSASF